MKEILKNSIKVFALESENKRKILNVNQYSSMIILMTNV